MLELNAFKNIEILLEHVVKSHSFLFVDGVRLISAPPGGRIVIIHIAHNSDVRSLQMPQHDNQKALTAFF